jgi:hypothetical protein
MKTMKAVLGVVTAGLLAAAPTHAAFAQDKTMQGAMATAPPAAASDHIVKSSGREVTPSFPTTYVPPEDMPSESDPESASSPVPDITLTDGTKLSIESNKAFITDMQGNKKPAPDGDHVKADGSVITIKNGAVTAGMPNNDATKDTGADAEMENPD